MAGCANWKMNDWQKARGLGGSRLLAEVVIIILRII
jgi:hypothetical protein